VPGKRNPSQDGMTGVSRLSLFNVINVDSVKSWGTAPTDFIAKRDRAFLAGDLPRLCITAGTNLDLH